METHKKKVTIFQPALSGGGAAKVMTSLAKGFLSCDYQVDFLVTKKRGEFKEIIPENCNLIDLNANRIIKAFPSIINYFYKSKPDYVLSALKPTNILAILSVLVSGSKTKIIITEHSTLSRRISGAKGIKNKYIVPMLMKVTYPFSDKIIAVSKGVADDLSQALKIDRKLIDVIYNPVVTEQLFSKSQAHVRHKWFHSNIPVLIGIGRLIQEKNFTLLIKAFSKVREKKKCKLMILGEGQKRDELEKLVQKLGLEKDVLLPGFVKNPYKYLKNSDLFVLSSNVEGLPTALIEAMACGTPVVSTDCPSGPREILEDGRWGELVEVNNTEKLADTISRVLNSSNRSSEALIERASCFSLENAMQEYIRIFNLLEE